MAPLNPPIPGDFAVESPPELGGGGGQMQDFALLFEMCIHGSLLGGVPTGRGGSDIGNGFTNPPHRPSQEGIQDGTKAAR